MIALLSVRDTVSCLNAAPGSRECLTSPDSLAASCRHHSLVPERWRHCSISKLNAYRPKLRTRLESASRLGGDGKRAAHDDVASAVRRPGASASRRATASAGLPRAAAAFRRDSAVVAMTWRRARSSSTFIRVLPSTTRPAEALRDRRRCGCQPAIRLPRFRSLIDDWSH